MNMTIDEKYLHLILDAIGVMEGEEVELIKKDNQISYKFFCPFCSAAINSNRKNKFKKTASLTPTRNNWSYRFTCTRGQSVYCRGTQATPTSFYNFVAMYSPELLRKYKRENGMEITQQDYLIQ